MSIHETFQPDAPIRCRDYRIGCVGAGFIMADVQLAAYQRAKFPVVAISSRSHEKASTVAQRWKIPKVYADPRHLIEDETVDIVDIAYPPHLQPQLIRHALGQPHVKGILAQKPLALDLQESESVVQEAEAAGKVLSVNQNMRYDQSMRVLRQLIDRGELGEIITATIEMRAVPHWQPFLKGYDRLTLLNMSIHHLDVLRFLLGEPEEIYTTARQDPRTPFEHTDGICASVIQFRSGALGHSLEDVWVGPIEQGVDSDVYIKWRMEGTEGLAWGTVGWPDYPTGSPSTLHYNSTRSGGTWCQPSWDTRWFPDAFGGVMEQLQFALSTNTPPALTGRDNLRTMALVEAGYRSIRECRAVKLAEFGF